MPLILNHLLLILQGRLCTRMRFQGPGGVHRLTLLWTTNCVHHAFRGVVPGHRSSQKEEIVCDP
jgi:hypothetical protein